MRKAWICILPVLVLLLPLTPQASVQVPEPEPPPQGPALSPGPPEPPEPPENPGDQAFRLAKEGRLLLKARKLPEGLAKMREALTLGEKAGLPNDELADLLDAYGTALLKAHEDDAAVLTFRRASALAPKDAEIRLDLAGALLRWGDADGALLFAQEAQKLGLKGEDAADARDVVQHARSQRLHDRLTIDASLSYGFDSNILQGSPTDTSPQIETIAGKVTRGATKTQGFKTRPQVAQFIGAVESEAARIYRMASPSPSEWGLPLNLSLDLSGRLWGRRNIGLWLGYRFFQTIITDAQQDTTGALPPADTFNFQEHTAIVRLQTRPLSFLDLTLRLEGFVNFTGLAMYAPYQGGFNATLDTIFIESPRWRTRLTYAHQFRRSFDQLNDGYLNGNRDQVRLSQELRTRWVRPQVRYQFTSDRTGTLSTDLPICNKQGVLCDDPKVNPMVNPAIYLGKFTYNAPLGYQGHQVSAILRALLPARIDISTAFRYEYQLYDGQYAATFTTTDTTLLNAQGKPVTVKGKTINLAGAEQRRDNRLTAELSVTKQLPHDFSLEAGYVFVDNLSNIVNGLDNRSYTKHTATLAAYYSF